MHWRNSQTLVASILIVSLLLSLGASCARPEAPRPVVTARPSATPRATPTAGGG